MTAVNSHDNSAEVDIILNDLRLKLRRVGGVTLVDNRLTIRWNMNEQLVDVQMIILHVTTPSEAKEEKRKHKELQRLFKKYPELDAELFHVDYNEWPK